MRWDVRIKDDMASAETLAKSLLTCVQVTNMMCYMITWEERQKEKKKHIKIQRKQKE